MFLAIFVLWKKYSRMLTVSSGHCFPILVMWIRIFLSGPIKPTGMVRTVICPSKMFSPFNCERKLVICYSAIYYSQTSGSRVKTIFLGYFWRIWTLYWVRIRIGTVPLCFNRFWYRHLWSFRLRFGYRVFRAIWIRTCGFNAVCSCICISNFGLSAITQWLKKSCHKSDAVFAFVFLFFGINSLTIPSDALVLDLLLSVCPVVVGLPHWLNMTKLNEPKDFFI